jgi:hypothetical protein
MELHLGRWRHEGQAEGVASTATIYTNELASRIQATDPYVQDAIAAICRRAELVGDGTAVADYRDLATQFVALYY